MDGIGSKLLAGVSGTVGVLSSVLAIRNFLNDNVGHAVIWTVVVILSIVLLVFLY